jgi:hypothetical protein
MSEIDAFVADFHRLRWGSNPFERALAIVRGDPTDALPFVRAVVEQIPDGGTFLDAALSYLPEGDWPEAVAHALAAFAADRKNEAAESVVAYAALQNLPSLHPHLDTIFRLRPNARTYYEDWPWRESGTSHVAFLEAVILDSASAHDDRIKAWRCLLATRDPAALTRATELTDRVDLNRQLRERGLPGSVRVESYFREVGVEAVEGGFRNLDTGRVRHVGFPPGYFPDGERPACLSREVHPTWTAPRSGPVAARFGGPGSGVCGHCREPTHQLLAVSPIPEGLPVTGLPGVTFETCLSCLGWEEVWMFYRHDAAGRPRCLARRSAKPPQFPSGPLRATPVTLGHLGARWRWQSWGLANSRENLNRLGGSPGWVQGADYPTCPGCTRTMGFVLQLDSNLPAEDGGEWLWGSGGMCYGFWCDHCKVSGFHWQCT